jgi:hypothetical protein
MTADPFVVSVGDVAERPQGLTVILGEEDPTLYRVDGTVILALAGMITLLSSRWPVPLPGLNALELGMIGLLVGHIAFVQYWMMLAFSLHGDKLS